METEQINSDHNQEEDLKQLTERKDPELLENKRSKKCARLAYVCITNVHMQQMFKSA